MPFLYVLRSLAESCAAVPTVFCDPNEEAESFVEALSLFDNLRSLTIDGWWLTLSAAVALPALTHLALSEGLARDACTEAAWSKLPCITHRSLPVLLLGQPQREGQPLY